MNSTNTVAAKIAEELNQMRIVTQKRSHSTHKRKIWRVLKEKVEKQSNAWPAY